MTHLTLPNSHIEDKQLLSPGDPNQAGGVLSTIPKHIPLQSSFIRCDEPEGIVKYR